MGGVGNIKSQLYASPLEGQLQITARRRLLGTTFVSVPAGGSASLTVATPLMPDILQNAGDGLLFDMIALVVTASASPGVSVTNLTATFNGTTPGGGLLFTGALLPAQPVSTQNAVSSVANYVSLMNPTPALLSSLDLEALRFLAIGTPLPPVQISIVVAVTFSNTAAAAITATANLMVFVRAVHGLQEG